MRRAAIAYDELVALARRYARRAGDAEDIVQDALIAAIAAGREDFSLPGNRRWLAGTIRRRAAFDARGAARRRARESLWQAERPGPDEAPAGPVLGTILRGLPKGLRVVAALALSGHTRTEIAYLLNLSDAALRQRIRELRKVLTGRGLPMPPEMAGLDLDLAYGAIRQALLPALKRHGGAFATHDPDGHLFVIRKISQ